MLKINYVGGLMSYHTNYPMSEVIEDFVQKTKYLDEADYGDFMRKENLYLSHMMLKLIVLDDSNIIRKLVEMQTYLQFTPNWDVEITREKLLTDANYIAELLQAHIQDWESAS